PHPLPLTPGENHRPARSGDGTPPVARGAGNRRLAGLRREFFFTGAATRAAVRSPDPPSDRAGAPAPESDSRIAPVREGMAGSRSGRTPCINLKRGGRGGATPRYRRGARYGAGGAAGGSAGGRS